MSYACITENSVSGSPGGALLADSARGHFCVCIFFLLFFSRLSTSDPSPGGSSAASCLPGLH